MAIFRLPFPPRNLFVRSHRRFTTARRSICAGPARRSRLVRLTIARKNRFLPRGSITPRKTTTSVILRRCFFYDRRRFVCPCANVVHVSLGRTLFGCGADEPEKTTKINKDACRNRCSPIELCNENVTNDYRKKLYNIEIRDEILRPT